MRKLLLALGFLISSVVVAHAVDTATVVASCGTPPTTYTAGQPFPVTQDPTGLLCSNSGGAVTATLAGKATAAAPSYSEGTSNPLSMNLTGDLRTIAKVASGGIASGAIASGAVASGAYASG